MKNNRNNELLSEHDMTKKILDFFRKPLITERVNPNSVRTGTPSPLVADKGDRQDDTITPVAGDAIFNDELKSLMDTVDKSARISSFKIYPSDNNVIIEGTMQKRQDSDSGIHFKLELLAGEVKTTMSGIDLNDNVSEILKKLKGYYSVWAEKWDGQIMEYQNKKEF